MAESDNNKPITFILSDGSINKSGSRILTEGIDLREFKKNPVMLYNHHRSSNWDQPLLLPIGRWVNIRIEGDKLLADAQFDMDDDFAAKVAGKVKKKILNAASVGVRILQVSTEPKYLLKGQTRATITKSRMMECSIVDIPGNGNALRLSYDFDGEVLELNGAGKKENLNKIVPLINTKKTEMKTIFNFFKLGAEASEADVLAAVTMLKNKNSEYETQIASLTQEIETLKGAEQKGKCLRLVDKAIADKKITESERENWMQLAESNYEHAEKALGNMKGFTSLSSQIESSTTADTTLSDADKYEKKWQAGELEAWEKANKEEYQRCQDAYFEIS